MCSKFILSQLSGTLSNAQLTLLPTQKSLLYVCSKPEELLICLIAVKSACSVPSATGITAMNFRTAGAASRFFDVKFG